LAQNLFLKKKESASFFFKGSANAEAIAELAAMSPAEVKALEIGDLIPCDINWQNEDLMKLEEIVL
jgi:hypothetical protein